jgi:hypothetical protein
LKKNEKIARQKFYQQVINLLCKVSIANQRMHTERRHTLSVMMQSVIPSGDAQAVLLLNDRYSKGSEVDCWHLRYSSGLDVTCVAQF